MKCSQIILPTKTLSYLTFIFQKMTIIQWNINGYFPQSGEMRNLIKLFNPTVIALQETNLKPAHTPVIQKFTLFRKDYVEGHVACGGVALFVKNSHSPRPIPLQTTLQAVAAQLTVNNIHLTVCSLYLPPGENIPENQLKNIQLQLPPPFILCGDFNAHNPLWGGSKINSTGKKVENFLINEKLMLLNGHEHTHFSQSYQTFSSIDLTICSPSIMKRVKWFVHGDLCSSDHFPIITTIGNDTNCNTVTDPNLQPKQFKWRIDKADWSKFKDFCQITDPVPEDPRGNFELIMNTILFAASKSIPQSTPNLGNRIPVPWWNEACRLAISQRIKAFKFYKKFPTLENFIEFKRCKAKAKWIIKTAKANSWKKFVQGFDSNTPSSVIWKNAKKISGIHHSIHIPSVLHNKRIVSDEKEIADIIASNFQFFSSNENYSPSFLNFKKMEETQTIDFSTNTLEPYNSKFSKSELVTVMKTLKNSTPGPDQIHNLMLSNLPDTMITNILNMFNNFWEKGFFPKEWKNATIIPVPKDNSSRLDPTKYRPISLTSCVCKLYEQLIANRLKWYLEKHNLLASIQCGARKNRSTVDNLVNLQSSILKGFSKKHLTAALFFDIEKAYDSTWKYRILKILHSWGLRGNLPTFIQQFLSERFFRVKINSTLSDEVKQENGISQGSVLSVLLFLIAINDIVKCLPRKVKGSLFVDDFAIYVTTKNIKMAKRLLTKCLKNLESWSEKTGFKFSTTKTKGIIFTRKQKTPKINLYIDRNKISFEKSIRFLGLIFDQKLLWNNHITSLKNNCLKKMRILNYLSHTSWGADKETMLLLYRSLIRSKLDYGSFIYGSASTSSLNKLNSIHNTCIRLATGAFKTSPVSSLYVEAQEPPLHLRRQLLLGKYLAKLKSLTHHPTHSIIFQSGTKIPLFLTVLSKTNFCDVIPAKIVNYPPWNSPDFTIHLKTNEISKFNLLNSELRHEFYSTLEKYSEYKTFFTDGSKMGHSAGCAFIQESDVLKFKLSPETSIFSAEAFAIWKALQFIRDSNYKKSIICSDSFSVLSSLENPSPVHPLIVQIQNLIHQLLSNQFTLVLCWSPGHVGIAGNSYADKAAKEAALEIGPFFPGSVSADDKRASLKKQLITDWELDWRSQHQNRLKQLTCGNVVLNPLKNLTRQQQVILSRLRIGHTQFSHSYIIKGKDKPTCDSCNSPLTVDHVLLTCPVFQKLREKHKILPELSSKLLTDLNYIQNTLSFIKETGLKI